MIARLTLIASLGLFVVSCDSQTDTGDSGVDTPTDGGVDVVGAPTLGPDDVPTDIATAIPQGPIDLMVSIQGFTMDGAQCGDDLSVRVINANSGSVAQAKVSLSYDESAGGNAVTGPLGPGESAVVSLTRPSNVPGGGYSALVRVDPEDEILETNEGNNEDGFGCIS